MYRLASEVEKALDDRTYAEGVMASVSKGGKGTFSYIPWNETAKLLTRIFGPFGWNARITHTANDFERGIYRTDLELTVIVEDENGVSRAKTLPGTGVGIVIGASADAHDTAIKGSRSDALSVAAKSLGNAFGLYLYDRGDPARSSAASSQQTSSASATARSSSADLGSRPSEKQMGVLLKAGYSQQQVDTMHFKVWKACIDAIFGKGEAPEAPAGKKSAPTKAAPKSPKPSRAEDDEDDDIPF